MDKFSFFLRVIRNTVDLVANGSHIQSKDIARTGFMMIRRSFLVVLGLVAAMPLAAWAQSPLKVVATTGMIADAAR